jgi:hypothetical protein
LARRASLGLTTADFWKTLYDTGREDQFCSVKARRWEPIDRDSRVPAIPQKYASISFAPASFKASFLLFFTPLKTTAQDDGTQAIALFSQGGAIGLIFFDQMEETRDV